MLTLPQCKHQVSDIILAWLNSVRFLGGGFDLIPTKISMLFVNETRGSEYEGSV